MIAGQQTEPLFLGVDLGTTRVKAGLFSAEGTVFAEAAFPTSGVETIHLPRLDTDPEKWWDATCLAIRDCIRTVGPQQIAAVCVGGQGPSLVCVGASGEVLRPAIMYYDRRAMPEAEEISVLLGRPVTVRSAYLPRILWLRRHEPHVYSSTRWFLQAWDFIVYRLTGSAVSTSPGGFYTPWDEEEIAVLGLDQRRFPPSVRTACLVGTVCRDAGVATGLGEGTPVVAGGNDFLLGTIGAGAAEIGVAQSQAGATGAFTLCWHSTLELGKGQRAELDKSEMWWCIPSPVQPGLVNVGASLSTSGIALDWLLCSVLKVSTSDQSLYQSALERAALVPTGAGGLLFLPYLTSGCSYPMSQGVIFWGLSLSHGPDHLIRAVLEGIAMAGRVIMDDLTVAGGRVDEIVTYGGQARSQLWNQIKADVWNRPVRIPHVLDAGCLGAAAIAAVWAGVYPSLASASQRMSRTGQYYLPNPETAAKYKVVYRRYCEIRHFVRELSARLGRLDCNTD